LWAMAAAPAEYDLSTTAKLRKLTEQRSALEAKLDKIDESDQEALEAIGGDIEMLDAEAQAITKDARVTHAEATKAVGTVFLILDPDGRVRREYRIPRSRGGASGNGGMNEAPKSLTPDDLSDMQRATAFTQHALTVRAALLKDDAIRSRVLALILHDKVRSEGLSVRHDANDTTLHASRTEGFTSPLWDSLQKHREAVDPLAAKQCVQDIEAYRVVKALSAKKLDALIDVLVVECVTARLNRKTELVWQLAADLGVAVRKFWRPDERWLAGYQKIQLTQLIGELRGAAYRPAAEQKKKSELVTELAAMFTDAAEGRLEDRELAGKLNAWLPANLRDNV
jgi:hypothetical protein